jgi:hypothetical protein
MFFVHFAEETNLLLQPLWQVEILSGSKNVRIVTALLSTMPNSPNTHIESFESLFNICLCLAFRADFSSGKMDFHGNNLFIAVKIQRRMAENQPE